MSRMEQDTLIAKDEITNTCTCTANVHHDDGTVTQEPYPCDGECWDSEVDYFAMLTEDLRKANETGWWKVTDLRLWHGNVSGYFYADTVVKLLEGMTVRSEWTMRYEVFADRIEYSLSHHDAMGSATTLTAVSEDEREEMGLY